MKISEDPVLVADKATDKPKVRMIPMKKPPPELNMDLISDAPLTFPNITQQAPSPPSSGHEIVVPIPRPALSPIQALSSTKHYPINGRQNEGISPMKNIPLSPLKGAPFSPFKSTPLELTPNYLNLANTPTMWNSISKAFEVPKQ